MKTLNRDELKEVMKLFFNKGVKVGKQCKPLNEIPMGSITILPLVEFEKFFIETFDKTKNEK